MSFQTAKREAVPLMVGLAGTSGSGKTYSALLLAAGIAGEGGKVGFIDTEAGRGSMYADDQNIIDALPGGEYLIKRLTEPFTPKKYADAINEAIKGGVTALVIDSASHEWEGFGGCCDIAENNKRGGMANWARAKMEHKKLMNMLTQCPMHVIFCLRAREKTKPMKDAQGKTIMVDLGMQAIQEKNFMYEMTVSMMLTDAEPGRPKITKCPKPLLELFTGKQALITKAVGEKLSAWAKGGAPVDMEFRKLKLDCSTAAMEGGAALKSFWETLSNEDKKSLKTYMTEFKATAEDVDRVEEPETELPNLFKKEG